MGWFQWCKYCGGVGFGGGKNGWGFSHESLGGF